MSHFLCTSLAKDRTGQNEISFSVIMERSLLGIECSVYT